MIIMATKQSTKDPNLGDDFVSIFSELGNALSEVFNDPSLKRSAKTLGSHTKKSAEMFKNRFSDEEVKIRFRNVGKAMEKFGQDIGKLFEEKK